MRTDMKQWAVLKASGPSSQKGISMIELLFTLFIVCVGLLGLASLQTQMMAANLESYQRAQALIFMQDMVDRLNVNRQISDCMDFTTDTTNGVPYVGQPVGSTDSNLLTISSLACGSGVGGTGVAAIDALAQVELASWDAALKGAGEVQKASATTQVGAMKGARGCISSTTDSNGGRVYTIAVAWQAQTSGAAPTNSCASGQYGSENLRRVVWTTMQFASLK
jgi:type IV pilus assembly protein PilV